MRTPRSRTKPFTVHEVGKDDTLVFHLVLSLPSIVHGLLNDSRMAYGEHGIIHENEAMSFKTTTFTKDYRKGRQVRFPNFQPHSMPNMVDHIVHFGDR